MSIERLNNGKRVVIRRVEDADKDKLYLGFEALSELSRYRRFLCSKNELYEHELECLLAVPEDQGAVIIALEYDLSKPDGQGRCIGLIQLIKEQHNPNSAEVALVVIDEYHNCGLGRLLLNKINAEAKQRQIQTLYFYTLSDNAPLAAILKKTDWNIECQRDFNAVTYIVKLSDTAEYQNNNLVMSADFFDSYQRHLFDRFTIMTFAWFKQCHKFSQLYT